MISCMLNNSGYTWLNTWLIFFTGYEKNVTVSSCIVKRQKMKQIKVFAFLCYLLLYVIYLNNIF